MAAAAVRAGEGASPAREQAHEALPDERASTPSTAYATSSRVDVVENAR